MQKLSNRKYIPIFGFDYYGFHLKYGNQKNSNVLTVEQKRRILQIKTILFKFYKDSLSQN